jgi:redox-sensing transcriptional repressor
LLFNGTSIAVLHRLPIYLTYLKNLSHGPSEHISATTIASALRMGDVQVRKDLALVSGEGRPKIGYETAGLITALQRFLGYDAIDEAVIVGAGRLGKALLGYDGFHAYGLNIVAAFDAEPSSETDGGKRVYPIADFAPICKSLGVRIGVITVPAQEAQQVCDMMVENGFLAIWNFAPVHLNAPENVLVQTENMAASLAMLSGHLSKRLSLK